MIEVFTRSNVQSYCDALAEGNEKIQQMIHRCGYPFLGERTGGFEGLVRIILEQQVSLASAFAVYRKLKRIMDPLTPEGLVRLSEDDFKSCGFSRQKTRYVKILANEILSGRLDPALLSSLPDDQVRQQLTAVKGIGNWTCDVYLLFCLNRLDIFPAGDLALIKSMVENELIRPAPSKADIEKISSRYSPLRSILAMILWHAYLTDRNIQPE